MGDWEFDFERLVAVLGLIFSAVMATSAVVAFKTWRRQIKGQSEHDLAKRLSAALYRLTKMRRRVLADLRVIERDTSVSKLGIASIPSRLSIMESLVDVTEQLEVEANVIWRDTISELIAAIAKPTSDLTNYVRAKVESDAASLIAFAASDGFVYTGKAFSQRLDGLTELLQAWLGRHVGREGAETLTEAQVTGRMRVIEDAAAALAADEWNELEDSVAQNAATLAEAYEAFCEEREREQARFDGIELGQRTLDDSVPMDSERKAEAERSVTTSKEATDVASTHDPATEGNDRSK